MFKPIVRMAAAVLVAGVIALAITAAPAARAVNGTAAGLALSQLTGKADRLRVPVKGAACSQHNWPNFEARCLFDVRQDAGEARPVRIIALR
jgi:hypothetical protein